MAKKPIPTPEELRQLLRYEPETGKLFWLPRDVSWFESTARPASHACANWNSCHAGKEAFTATDHGGYKVGTVLYRVLLAHRVAWAIQTGCWPEKQVDHVNGDRSDNKLINLRSVDRVENMKNMKRPSTNTSGHVGIRRDTRIDKWTARICVNYRDHYIGSYDDIKSAIDARKAAEAFFGFHQNHGRD